MQATSVPKWNSYWYRGAGVWFVSCVVPRRAQLVQQQSLPSEHGQEFAQSASFLNCQCPDAPNVHGVISWFLLAGFDPS